MASTSNPFFREKCLRKAQISIEIGRFRDSVNFMIQMVKSLVPGTDLSLFERNFLYTVLMKYFEEYLQAFNDHNSRSYNLVGFESEVAKFYSNELREEIIDAYEEMKQFIYLWLIDSSQSAESTVFYVTLIVDLSCYLVEIQDDHELPTMAHVVIQAYKDVKAVAKTWLTWASPARLRLTLHMSEFYSEILQMPEKGVKIAKKALAGADAAIGTVTEEEILNEINGLMSKLREFIILWTE